MTVTLEARKYNLLSQIEKLRMEVEMLKCLEYKNPAIRYCTDSIEYTDLETSQKNLRS